MPGSREEDFLRNEFSPYDLYGQTHFARTPAPGVMKFVIWVDPSFVIITIDQCLGVKKKIFKGIIIFTIWLIWPHPSARIPAPGVTKFQILVDPSLSYLNYILSLSDLCLGVKKKILKEMMHFHYMTYIAIPQRKNPCPGGNEIYNLGRPFLGHHNHTCPWVEKKIFKEIHQFYSKITAPFAGGHEIYNFFSPYPTDATFQIWSILAQ